MASLQCLKRVHLEINRKELVQYSPATQAAFAVGNAVGDVAIEVFGQGRGEELQYDGGLKKAEQRTRELLDSWSQEPVFEATLSHEDVLVREDVLLPEKDGWHIIEVKASTSLKPQYVQDCAIQAWVHQGAGYDFVRFSLAHVDNQFVYQGDGDYTGLLVNTELTDMVRALTVSVPQWVAAAKEAAAGPEPEVPVGAHCFAPYECPFTHYCWPNESDYPVRGLGGSRKKLGELVQAGYRDVREVPAELLSSETHLRIRRVTRSGKAEILPAAGAFVRALSWPRYFLDFETVAPAVPVWPGIRPYEALPFQWSCHVQDESGALQHFEFLDLSGAPPMRPCAEQLIAQLGDSGPIMVYTNYEKGVINRLAERYPDLAANLHAIVARLIDLAPVTKNSYYHPDMRGSWSLKAVLPTIGASINYADLSGVAEGTQASAAYLQAINPQASDADRERIKAELLEYCRYDTLAMVDLASFLARH